MADPTVVIARLSPERSVNDPIGFLQQVLGSFGEVRIRPLMPESSKPREEQGARTSPRSENPLAEFFRIELVGDGSDVEGVVSLLNATKPDVSTAYIEPDYALPAADPTPGLSACQLYLGPAPDGIDAKYVWTQGVTGSGVRLAGVEMGWLTDHEDFDQTRIKLHAPNSLDPYARHHGTASVGVTFATENQIGLTGIAHGVDAIDCFSTLGPGNSPAAAIVAAVNGPLKEGDVLLVELQAAAPKTRRWIPIEYFDAEYEAIAYATKMGISVVAAAGNGDNDLDDPVYGGRFDRAKRDSGAILVGAGGAPGPVLARCRLLMSNWGSRVDVQGYGENVCTTGFGPLFGRSQRFAENRWYTNGFNGTSSAAAIVAGACVLIQSFAKKELGRSLAPRDLRDRLVRTGTGQRDHKNSPDTKHIGPLPDLRCVIAELRNLPCVKQPSGQQAAVGTHAHGSHVSEFGRSV